MHLKFTCDTLETSQAIKLTVTRKNNMKNTIKLNREETNKIYRDINSASYNLANNVKGAPVEPEARKAKYYEVQNTLRKAYLSYDRVTKTATAIKPLKSLEALKSTKTFPKSLEVTAKASLKSKRI